jgi:hypothetical protein
MSVVAGKRGEGELKVITVSGNLCDYTLQITNTEKHFPKRYRWSITNRIVQITMDIDDHLIHANSIFVRPDDYSLARRQRYQLEALELTYVLLRNIDRAYRRFGVGSFNAEHWTGLIRELQRLIRGWYNKDKERYANIG